MNVFKCYTINRRFYHGNLYIKKYVRSLQNPRFLRIDLNREFYFSANTDEECSLVCPEKEIPADTTVCEKNWRAFRICGTLDFSLVGMISNIASALAKEHIPIFAVSTFNTDYIFVKDEYFPKAVQTLRGIGCQIKNVI